jgi:putative addiction module component (TIGR02574 family)
MRLLGALARTMIASAERFGVLMGAETLNKLRSEALMLPESERAELAHALVKSLDTPTDKDAADAWEHEILRRLAEIDAGTAKLIDRNEFRRRMQARIGSQ